MNVMPTIYLSEVRYGGIIPNDVTHFSSSVLKYSTHFSDANNLH